jgi:8-oxo-dGTP diphosphatase
MGIRHRFYMTDSAKRHAPILAAGGIVLRGKTRPRIAIVRLRREKAWVLPKGKLMPREHPRDAAQREVLEETGYRVAVHEFLGSMSYAAEGKIKIVQFWLMRAIGLPVRELSDDVKAVKWLPLRQAIAMLNRPHEKVFLTHAGPIALDYFKRPARAKPRSLSRNGGARSRKAATPASVEHVIALDYEKTRPNAFAKALASWRARAVQSSARKAS